MKIKSKYASAILVGGLLTGYCSNSVALAYNFAVSKAVNQNLSNAVADARADFEDYKATGNLVSLEESITKFGDIAKFIESEEEIEEISTNIVYKLFLEQREELYLIANRTGSGKYIIDYAESILNGWIQNRNMTIYSRIFLVEGIIDYNKDKVVSINEELNKILKYYDFLLVEEWENPEDVPSREWFEQMQDQITDDSDLDFSGPPPIYDEGTQPEPPSKEDEDEYPDLDNVWEGDKYYSSDTYYQKEGNKCFLVKRKFKDTVLIETTKEAVPKEDYVYCGIYDYIFEDAPPVKVEIDDEYIYEDQNVESDNYIYYTVNKNEINPYYYNSGIRVSLNNQATYNQLKDALYQVAIKAKGFSTDSNNKSLTIIEGKPIVISNEQEIYSKEQIESLLDKFKFIDLKIQKFEEKVTSLNNDLIDYIKENSNVNVRVDGETISVSEVEIDNSTIMVSLNEVAPILNLKVENKSNIYTVKGSDNYISFSVGSLSYKEKNNQERKFLAKPKMKNSGLYIDLKTLCEEMGYTITWDSEDLKFDINKKEKKQ